MKPTTLTLEACIHGLAHHIAKVEATKRNAFFIGLLTRKYSLSVPLMGNSNFR